MIAMAAKAFRCLRMPPWFLSLIFHLPACFFLGWAAVAAGPAHPDFSGTWTLDSTRSDFGPLPIPAKMTDIVEQSGTEIKVKRSMANEDQEAHYDLRYLLDGSETVNCNSANRTKSRAHWEQSSLIVETQTEVEGLPLKIVDRWTADSGCACLLISRHFQNEKGEIHLLLTMMRKSVGPLESGPRE